MTDVRAREPNTRRDKRNFQKESTALHFTLDRKRQQAEQYDPKGEVEDYRFRNPFCH